MGSTSWVKNSSTCSGARPTNNCGSIIVCSLEVRTSSCRITCKIFVSRTCLSVTVHGTHLTTSRQKSVELHLTEMPSNHLSFQITTAEGRVYTCVDITKVQREYIMVGYRFDPRENVLRQRNDVQLRSSNMVVHTVSTGGSRTFKSFG